MSETNGRILTLNNGRSPSKKSGDFITRGQAEQMVLAEREENERMVKWYMQQLPELVARMVADALAANGLTMLPPGWKATAPPEAQAGTGEDAPAQSGDAAAPESA